jgi:hypothetical protein
MTFLAPMPSRTCAAFLASSRLTILMPVRASISGSARTEGSHTGPSVGLRARARPPWQADLRRPGADRWR